MARSQNSRLWFVTTTSASSARRRAPCTKHDVPKYGHLRRRQSWLDVVMERRGSTR